MPETILILTPVINHKSLIAIGLIVDNEIEFEHLFNFKSKLFIISFKKLFIVNPNNLIFVLKTKTKQYFLK
ncbi:hypothetical protein GCM10007332_03770 [Epilithonimonas arachidiradicis]|uniref:Uncharacterized protein n=1 Tax=Epilithonimonas arachidiradicis TaxID=1617282 RepID=A0ABQ1WXZ4_9FLAO|nr:hypothetical protein GCM10007332_03770 [Epilithonimonas arachidiradicis]